MSSKPTRQFLQAGAAALCLALTGCGGGDASNSAVTGTLTGVAAVGDPIAGGTVNIQCASGGALAATTSTAGAWQVNLVGQGLPCAVQVTGGTVKSIANATAYHSIALTFGTVNITPLTDLLVANLAATANPSVWFGGLGTSAAGLALVNQAALDASIAKIRSTLATLAPLATLNPITTAFTAAPGNGMDDMLAAFRAAMTKAAVSYSMLLTSAATPAFTAPAGFSVALGNTFAGTVSGGSIVVPTAPSGVASSATSTTEISLSWNAVPGATSYAVYRSTAANLQPTASNKVATVTTPASTSTELTASTAYFFKVIAANPAGESVASAEFSATTQAVAPPPPAISGLSPATAAAGALVTISGTNLGGFVPAPLVRFGTALAAIASANATAIVVTVPAGLAAGSIAVTVANGDGTGAVAAGNFTATATVPPDANALSSGTDYGIVYSGGANTPPAGPNPGIDHRTSISARFDTTGDLTGYPFSVSEAPTIGTSSVAELATDGVMSVGRWTNGTLGGSFYGGTLVFDAGHGLPGQLAHARVVLPQLAGPSVSVATPPTCAP